MPSSTQSETHHSLSWSGLVSLFIVYFVWGSTYLAIRIAVGPGSGFPPFFMVSSRVLTAGTLLLVLAGLTRQRLRPTTPELITVIASGVLLWLCGNGLVSWAEQRSASGMAALIVGATPIFVAMIEAVIDRKPPSLLLIVSLLIGFSGIIVLSYPVLRSGIQADILSIGLLLVGAFSWGIGSLLQSRRPVGLQPMVSSGYQHLSGGIGLLAAALITHEPVPTPSHAAWMAWLYLVLIGSVLAFTSFVRALRLLPISIVMTYGYVNPVIAVLLGWLILGEPITIWTISGTALILLGVAGVFRVRSQSRAAH
jgi:drug/metabolite transporter (DMT)-like permease